MSRRNVPAGNGLVCFVGWDRPTGSYFAQVEKGPNPDDESSPLFKFRGMGYGANIGQTVRTVEEIASELAAVGIVIPEDTVAQLRADKSPDSHPNRPGRPILDAILKDNGLPPFPRN